MAASRISAYLRGALSGVRNGRRYRLGRVPVAGCRTVETVSPLAAARAGYCVIG